eukprot:m.21282 g.21282  ORF g.21282 m.21282 type:complete len:81 (+) comp10441_c0_seq1:4608-4850(+)
MTRRSGCGGPPDAGGHADRGTLLVWGPNKNLDSGSFDGITSIGYGLTPQQCGFQDGASIDRGYLDVFVRPRLSNWLAVFS